MLPLEGLATLDSVPSLITNTPPLGDVETPPSAPNTPLVTSLPPIDEGFGPFVDAPPVLHPVIPWREVLPPNPDYLFSPPCFARLTLESPAPSKDVAPLCILSPQRFENALQLELTPPTVEGTVLPLADVIGTVTLAAYWGAGFPNVVQAELPEEIFKGEACSPETLLRWVEDEIQDILDDWRGDREASVPRSDDPTERHYDQAYESE
ncbi:hypothetical protein OH77DRAFT_1013329 [Trametes cingulata]|nr:hypothetical protein OH77DRAFT_1013329 [Trametes cingulata]